MQSLNIFITGGTTALGREATRQLAARGHKVTALTQGSAGAVMVRQDGGLPAYSDPFRAGEMRSLLLMSKADVVLHLMPQMVNNFPHRDTDWVTNTRVLKEGTNALLEAASATGVKFIVYPGDARIYGAAHGEPFSEDSPLHTPTAFRAALETEKRVLSGSVPGCVLRSGLVYGGDDSGTIALKDALLNGRSVYMGDGHHNLQSWVHAGDLARAVVAAAEAQPAGQIFNIADDQPATPAEFAAALADGLGVSQPRNMTGFSLNMMTSDLQRDLIDMSLTLKTDKAKSVLGWTPRYPNYKAGVEQTLLHWRTQITLAV